MEYAPQYRLMDIHDEFKNTDFGKDLASRVRYERYKPEAVTNDRWVDVLGADVNNLLHLPLTYGLAQDFVRSMHVLQPGYLSEEDGQLLQVAALIHDWAEAIVGDISFGDKTDQDERAERAAFEANLSRFYSGDPTLINKARTEIVFDHSGQSRLGMAFNAIERVGYLRTALRAGEHIAKGDAPDCDRGLRWLVADVLAQQPQVLITYARTFLPVQQYLVHKQTHIARTFALIDADPAVFHRYPPDQQARKQTQFYESYASWKNWEQTRGSPSV